MTDADRPRVGPRPQARYRIGTRPYFAPFVPGTWHCIYTTYDGRERFGGFATRDDAKLWASLALSTGSLRRFAIRYEYEPDDDDD